MVLLCQMSLSFRPGAFILLYTCLIFISSSLTITASESYKLTKIVSELNRTGDSFKKTELLIEAGNESKGTNPDAAISYFLQAEKRLAGLSDKNQRSLLQTKIWLGRISIALSNGAYDEAMRYDSLALFASKQLNNKVLEAQALMSLGSIFYHQSLYDQAQKVNIQALQLNRQTNDRKTEGKILTNMGTIEFFLGNTRKADSLFRIPLKLAAQSNDDDLLGASYLNLGLLNYYRGHYDEAAGQFSKAIRVYLRIDGRDGLAICYQNLSNIGFARGDISMALDNTWLQMGISRQLGDKHNEAKAFHNLGEASMLLGDYEHALEYYLVSLNLKYKLKDLKEIAMTELSIGHLHFKTGNYLQALDYSRKASQNYEKTKYLIGIGKGYSALGNVMTEWKKTDSALYYFRKAEKIFSDTEDVSSLASTFLNLGTVFLSMRDMAKAERYFLLGREKGYELEDAHQIFKSFLMLSTLKTEQANQSSIEAKDRAALLKEALDYSKTAFQLADSAGFLDKKKEAATSLMKIYMTLGDDKNALHFAQLEMTLSDSLSGMQRAEAIAHAEIRWKAEKKQTEINQLIKERRLQSELINQKSKLNKRLTLLILFVLSVLILMIIIAIQYIKNKEKQKNILFQLHRKEVTLLKLQNLNSRLSPHLFFNLLNSLGDNLEEREKMKHQIRETTSLLRSSLENAEEMAIPLARELNLVSSFLELQKIRVPEPFTMEIRIEDSINMETLLPAMSVQIPVENAIKHGLMPLDGNKLLQINIENHEDGLRISVLDNGVGRSDSGKRTKGTGTGLKLIYQTIHLLNQQNRKQITIAIEDLQPRGTAFRMTIPRGFSFEL